LCLHDHLVEFADLANPLADGLASYADYRVVSEVRMGAQYVD
jgi:hypothetical protein